LKQQFFAACKNMGQEPAAERHKRNTNIHCRGLKSVFFIPLPQAKACFFHPLGADLSPRQGHRVFMKSLRKPSVPQNTTRKRIHKN
jgi:hypothetical protein